MKMTTKTTTQSAAQAYQVNRSDIARLLDVMEMELDKHGQRAEADPHNWGFAGDLVTIRRGMINLVASISSMDAVEVERFLDEAV